MISRVVFGAFGIRIESEGGIIIQKYPIGDLFDQIAYFILFEVIGTFLPIAMTLTLYLRVYNYIKKTTEAVRPNYQFLWYVAIQIFCFVPSSIIDGVFMFLQYERAPFEYELIESVCHRSWGFLNLLAYWYLRYTDEDTSASEQQSDLDGSSVKSLVDMDETV